MERNNETVQNTRILQLIPANSSDGSQKIGILKLVIAPTTMKSKTARPSPGCSPGGRYAVYARPKNVQNLGIQLKSASPSGITAVSMYHLNKNDRENPDKFLKTLSDMLTAEICLEIEEKTRGQSNNKFWYELRYGRITASTIFEARAGVKYNSNLFKRIMTRTGGASFTNAAIERGKRLEPRVLKVVEKKLDKTIKQCGLILNKNYPAFGASPDGIGDNFVVEIKCPTTSNAVKRYYNNNKIANKCAEQLRLQMLMCEKDIGYFCVADPGFEHNQKVEVIEVKADAEKTGVLVEKVLAGWKTGIFPYLV